MATKSNSLRETLFRKHRGGHNASPEELGHLVLHRRPPASTVSSWDLGWNAIRTQPWPTSLGVGWHLSENQVNAHSGFHLHCNDRKRLNLSHIICPLWLSDRGSLERPSASACSYCLVLALVLVNWQCMYISTAQRWSRAASNDEMPFFGPSIAVRGLWSVMTVNSWPYKYWWNDFILQMKDKASFSSCV